MATKNNLPSSASSSSSVVLPADTATGCGGGGGGSSGAGNGSGSGGSGHHGAHGHGSGGHGGHSSHAGHGHGANSSNDMIHVPLVHDTLTFDGRQATRLKDMEKRVEFEMKRKKREWEREVERMREEFLELHPSDKVWGSDELLNDPLVSKRRGSTEILDCRKMKTLFLDYPDTGRRYKLRFNVSGFDPKNIRVTTDGDRIVVRAVRTEEKDGGEGGEIVEREYCRKIQKPKEVDHTKFKSYLTSDSILIVEAPLPPTSINLRKVIHSPSHSHGGCSHGGSSRSRSPSNSPGPDTPSKEKIGVPIFREENGHRRMHLVIDMGTMFKPHDITVQVIKDNKIMVKAKHEEKTTERLSKSKFFKEYELGEKIETYSLSGGLAADGKLIVGAYAKGHGEGFAKAGTPAPPPVVPATGGAGVVNSTSSGGGGAGGLGAGGGDVKNSSGGGGGTEDGNGDASTPCPGEDEEGEQEGGGTDLEPCNVLPAITSTISLPETTTAVIH